MKQLVKQENLCPCYFCGGKNVELWKRDNGQFQLRCPDCEYKTQWGKKTEIIIDWFNYYLFGAAYNKKKGKK